MSGFTAGFVSGIATTAAMGARCRQDSGLRKACVAGALLSNVATFVLLWVVAVTVVPAHVLQLAPSLVCATVAAAGVAALSLAGRRGDHPYLPLSGRAFSVRQALLFAVLLSTASAALADAKVRFGDGGLLIGTAVAGFVDLHAAGNHRQFGQQGRRRLRGRLAVCLARQRQSAVGVGDGVVAVLVDARLRPALP